MTDNHAMGVALIIPAYNEETRILQVLRAARESKLATEVIVVSDGSRDRTAEVAQIPGVTVLNLARNIGKGGAMAAGVKATTAPIIAFLDADLQGLRPEHIDGIIRPLMLGQCDMCVGIFRGGKVLSDTAQWISPYLSGQRAMKRELFEAIPYVVELRMGVEVAINNTAKKRRARVIRVVLYGVSNCYKEQKLGFVKGVTERTKMYTEIGRAMVKTRRKRRPKRSPWLH